MTPKLCTLRTLAQSVANGAKVAIPSPNTGVAMAATLELLRYGVHDLHLVCVPTSGLQADVMIGAGAVAAVETSAISLGEFGTGPRFAAAARESSVRILEATCAAIHAAVQAGQKGIPFIPVRGLLETDVLANRPDWKTIANPFDPDDPIVVLPAIRPDVALFHAPLADRYGNVFIGRWRELLTMSHAAHETLVTVERMTDDNLMDDPNRAPAVIPSLYITRIAHVPRGAAPVRFGDEYETDQAFMSRYAAAARTAEGFRDFLRDWLAETAPSPVAA
ncbi:MAG: CoA-transferase [Betaproteobacteria bacterium]